MITLGQAIRKLQKHIINTDVQIFHICDDLDDCWVFDWRYKNSPEEFTNGDLFKIDKKTGDIEIVYIGLPNEPFFEMLLSNKNKVDISKYLKQT